MGLPVNMFSMRFKVSQHVQGVQTDAVWGMRETEGMAGNGMDESSRD